LRQRRRFWSSEALIVAALILLPLLFWWRLWALDPADRAGIPQGDLASQYYPLQLFAARELSAGHLPAWDPYLNAGQPGLADIQTGTFYPFNLLSNLLRSLLGLPFTMGWLTAQIVLHFSLASLFTYLFVRHLARRARARLPAARFAGALAALSFTYAGYLTTFPVQQITILETAVWLPLVLLFVDLAIETAGAHVFPISHFVFGAGLALGCALLAGHPQTAMYVVYATLAYGLFRAASSKQQAASGKWQVATRYLLLATCHLPLALALAAVQIVPTLQFIARSTRAGLTYDAVASGFLLAEITHLLYPGYFGGSPQYVGLLPPILAVAALFIRRARREVLFWIVVGIVAFLVAFGGNTFLYSVAYLLAPGFGAIRNQERIVYLFSFAVSVLAGYGALVLVQPVPRLLQKGFHRFGRGLAWVFFGFLALTALWYLGYLQGVQQAVEVNMFEGVLRHHALILLILGGAAVLFFLRRTRQAGRYGLMGLALGLVWLNLFTINWQFNVIDPELGGPAPSTAEGPFVDSGLVSFLQQQPGTFRISSAGLLPGGASAGAVYKLEDITANTPLRLDSFQQFEDKVGSWQRWQLLNVRYVLSKKDLDGPGLERVYEEDKVKVYEVGDPLPRAWLVHSTVTANDDGAIDLLNAADFDPRLSAVLPPEAGLPALPPAGVAADPAQVVETGPGRLVLSVSPGQDGLLVISQPFYPGWRARVDGRDVPIYRADYLLQGIAVRAGPHQVELDYHLALWPAIVSLLAWGACLGGLVARPGRNPKNDSFSRLSKKQGHGLIA
jgi:hypothetical protein